MDMARVRRPINPVVFEPEDGTINHFHEEKKINLSVSKWLCLSLVGFIVLPTLIFLSQNVVSRESSSRDSQISRFEYQSVKDTNNHNEDYDDKPEQHEIPGMENSFENSTKYVDPLLDGLLVDAFSLDDCHSRYQAHRYRKPSKYKASGYLIEKLRKYEALHQKCGPDTEAFNRSLRLLKTGKFTEASDCKYVVWISNSGLGNRIVTMAASFIYAILTNRVLLIDRRGEMSDLFCEPFPGTSWFLPEKFPFPRLLDLNESSTLRYGYMLNRSLIMPEHNNSYTNLPPYVYLHLTHNYDFYDKLFFCEKEQNILNNIPWLLMKTDNYFLPSFYLMPTFATELEKLFPNKNAIFHHVCRYLFHPSNQVWGLITRFYHSYLAHARRRIGLQIRTYDTGFFQNVFKQVMSCSLRNKVLPQVADSDVDSSEAVRDQKPDVVLVTSLDPGYYERIRTMYWEHPASDGRLVSIYQPSHEGWQQTEKKSHNVKAWAEMYLLSLSDVLITSPWSTFGYVAQGLAGIKPFIFYKADNESVVPDPPCGKVMSIEPCFHSPPFYDCAAGKGIDTGKVLPFVKHCEDVSWGLKIAEDDDI